mgnify:FL=1
MKLPRFLAGFLNWVEGEELFPVPEKASGRARPERTEKARPKRKPQSPVRRKDHGKALSVLYHALAVVVCLTVIITLLTTVSWLPRFGGDHQLLRIFEV